LITGTLLNCGAIIVGSVLGILLGSRLPKKIKQSVILALGMFTVLFAIQLFLKTENAIIPLLSILGGVLIGEWLNFESALESISARLEKRLLPNRMVDGNPDGSFVRGFLSTSLIYCSGPMAILGAIQNGLSGEVSTLAVKSVLDGFASLAFASSLGIGVAFSSLPVFLYQGLISLFASQVQSILTTSMINELTSVGGIILASIGVSSFLEIKSIRTANFLPALVLAPIITWLFTFAGK
jgi:uncharacterized protein